MIGNGFLDVLEEYCGLIERCLNLRPTERPTAMVVTECLRRTSLSISALGTVFPTKPPQKFPSPEVEDGMTSEEDPQGAAPAGEDSDRPIDSHGLQPSESLLHGEGPRP